MIERNCERCGMQFISSQPYARFCSERCRRRARDSRRRNGGWRKARDAIRKQLRYQTDPEFRARRSERARRWYARHADYARNRSLNYYYGHRDKILAKTRAARWSDPALLVREEARAMKREQLRKERETSIDRRLARLRLKLQLGGSAEYERWQSAHRFQRAMAERGEEIRARKRELMRDPERRRKKREHDVQNRIKRTALFTTLRELGWLDENYNLKAP